MRPSVAPIIARTTSITSSPASTIATSSEAQSLLIDKPRLATDAVDFDALCRLPADTLGGAYVRLLEEAVLQEFERIAERVLALNMYLSFRLGRASFEVERLNTNLTALIDALNKSKPASSKGVFLRKVAVSSTMGIGVRVDTGTLQATGQ